MGRHSKQSQRPFSNTYVKCSRAKQDFYAVYYSLKIVVMRELGLDAYLRAERNGTAEKNTTVANDASLVQSRHTVTSQRLQGLKAYRLNTIIGNLTA
jgi:hypothetical protein